MPRMVLFLHIFVVVFFTSCIRKGREGGKERAERGAAGLRKVDPPPLPPPPPGPFLTYSHKLHKFDLVEMKKAQFW